MGYHFVQALEHLNEATQSLSQFSGVHLHVCG